jgi:glycosyltransferase involved in cell wall biosynthesis
MQLLEEEDIFLTVAGEWWENNSSLRELLKKPRVKDRVEIVDRYVSETEAAEYFSRADIVVLPYRSATGTGIVPLAYHYGKPVIAARTGGIPEVVFDGVSGRLFEPENPHALAGVIREFRHTSPESMGAGVKKVAEGMSWKGLAACILGMITNKQKEVL